MTRRNMAVMLTMALAAGCAGQAAQQGRPTVAAQSAAPQHRALDVAAWESAQGRGEFEEVPLPAGAPHTEESCGRGQSTATPAGTVRLTDEAPLGAVQRLYRERGTDRVWVVTLLPPPRHGNEADGRPMMLPATHCFFATMPLPPGTHLAGSIDVR